MARNSENSECDLKVPMPRDRSGARIKHASYFSDAEAVTYAAEDCAKHAYAHSTHKASVDHLRKTVKSGIEATLLSPFRRLWRPKGFEKAIKDASTKGMPLSLLERLRLRSEGFYRPQTVGMFWDILTLIIPLLWLAILLTNLAIRLWR